MLCLVKDCPNEAVAHWLLCKEHMEKGTNSKDWRVPSKWKMVSTSPKEKVEQQNHSG